MEFQAVIDKREHVLKVSQYNPYLELVLTLAMCFVPSSLAVSELDVRPAMQRWHNGVRL